MASIERFEDINAWKKAIELNDSLYSITERFPFSKDFTLKHQMKSSCLSISSNIAEGFERDSNKAFAYFLKIAKGSAGEFRSQLYVAKNQGYLDAEEFAVLYSRAEEISKMLGSLIRYLRKRMVRSVIDKIKSFLFF